MLHIKYILYDLGFDEWQTKNVCVAYNKNWGHDWSSMISNSKTQAIKIEA